MSYLDELVKNLTDPANTKGEASVKGDVEIYTDRYEERSSVVIAWIVNANGKEVFLTPEEVERLLTKDLVRNVYRNAEGSLCREYAGLMYARTLKRAIVCGIMAPTAKANVRPEILAYAKKMGYVSDMMIPVEMVSGTKSLIFNEDGTYSISYSWHESTMKSIERNLLNAFTERFFSEQSIKVKEDGVLLVGLSEEEVFNARAIEFLRKYDIQLYYLSSQFDKELLIWALQREMCANEESERTYALACWCDDAFEKNGDIRLTTDKQECLSFNRFGECHMNCGEVRRDDILGTKACRYEYKVTTPYSESIRVAMLDTVKLLKRKFGDKVKVEFCPFSEMIIIICDDNTLTFEIERELICLDYVLTLLKNKSVLQFSCKDWWIIEMLEADSTGRFCEMFHAYKKFLRSTLMESASNESSSISFWQKICNACHEVKRIFAEG